MEPNTRITQQELAERLQVSQTTVSRALARSPLLSAATRDRILLEAERIGYRPDPGLASLNAYLHAKRPVLRGTLLAWLGKRHPRLMNDSCSWDACIFRAARERAEKLGYQLDYFWINDPKIPRRRLETILHSRNAVGLILGTQVRAYGHTPLKIDRYSVVAIGKTLYSPKVDQISPDHFASIITCYRKLWKLGYRRIGLAISKPFASRAHGQWYAGYLLEQMRKDSAPVLPILECPEDDDASLRRWLKRWTPDCIITALEESSQGVVHRAMALRRMGKKIPEDIGFALLNMDETQRTDIYSGIVEPISSIGAGAIDILTRRVIHNQRGIPESRIISIIEGKWSNGLTLKPQR